MKIEELYELYKKCGSVTTDSLSHQSGAIFFALRGETFDGNKFAQSAIDNGCSYAVIDNKAYEGEKTILVEDSLKTLQQLANFHRRQLTIPIIGITGTNGKTTTKELVSTVLRQKFNVYNTQGNFNNHIGVPLTLLSIKPEHEIAVVEMGANHPHEIKDLVEIVEPDFGIITNVGKAHLQGFGSFEGVINTKKELYDYIKVKGKTIFLNASDSILTKIAKGINQITYGVDCATAFVQGTVKQLNPYLQVEWCVENGAKQSVQTHLIGAYNINNVLAAICVANHFDISAEKINLALSMYEPTNNRSQLKKTDRNTLIIDAYNANPTSMRVAVENFAQIEESNKLVILGDMLELGTDSEKEHADIVHLVQTNNIPAIFVGKEFEKIDSLSLHFSDVESCIEYLKDEHITNSFILIKGSHGIHLEKIIEYL